METEPKKEKKSVKNKKLYYNKFAVIMKHVRNPEGKLHNLMDVQRGTNVSYPVLWDLKAQKRDNFNERTLNDIAGFLGVTVPELMGKYKEPVEQHEFPRKSKKRKKKKTAKK